jgi:heme exporter protein C
MTEKTRALSIVSLIGVTVALAMMFLYAPTEALQGDIQRIFYVHVPSAWIAYLAVIIVAAASVLVLARRTDWERWDRMASASAELGVVFTTIVLTTGPIWGRRVWGVWWVWDARLTSTLVLWLIYVGYLVFRALSPPGERRARLSAVVGLVGALDIPVIHFAVIWWRTLHPLPTVLRPGGPDLPGAMVLTLMVSLVAFTILFVTLLALRIRLAEAADRVEAIELPEPARV